MDTEQFGIGFNSHVLMMYDLTGLKQLHGELLAITSFSVLRDRYGCIEYVGFAMTAVFLAVKLPVVYLIGLLAMCLASVSPRSQLNSSWLVALWYLATVASSTYFATRWKYFAATHMIMSLRLISVMLVDLKTADKLKYLFDFFGLTHEPIIPITTWIDHRRHKLLTGSNCDCHHHCGGWNRDRFLSLLASYVKIVLSYAISDVTFSVGEAIRRPDGWFAFGCRVALKAMSMRFAHYCFQYIANMLMIITGYWKYSIYPAVRAAEIELLPSSLVTVARCWNRPLNHNLAFVRKHLGLGEGCLGRMLMFCGIVGLHGIASSSMVSALAALHLVLYLEQYVHRLIPLPASRSRPESQSCHRPLFEIQRLATNLIPNLIWSVATTACLWFLSYAASEDLTERYSSDGTSIE